MSRMQRTARTHLEVARQAQRAAQGAADFALARALGLPIPHYRERRTVVRGAPKPNALWRSHADCREPAIGTSSLSIMRTTSDNTTGASTRTRVNTPVETPMDTPVMSPMMTPKVTHAETIEEIPVEPPVMTRRKHSARTAISLHLTPAFIAGGE